MTKHQMHIQSVRERLNSAIRYVPTERRRGGITPFGNFAEQMSKIARERDEWLWTQRATTTGGAPKDLSNTLRRFASGKSGMHSRALRLVELTCLHFEMEHERLRISGVETAVGVLPPAKVEVNPEVTHQAAPPVDPEFAALHAISEALGSLEDDRARVRVLDWALAKYGKGAA